eukprot:3201320-Pyramimonas_sp.AAC.1
MDLRRLWSMPSPDLSAPSDEIARAPCAVKLSASLCDAPVFPATPREAEREFCHASSWVQTDNKQ